MVYSIDTGTGLALTTNSGDSRAGESRLGIAAESAESNFPDAEHSVALPPALIGSLFAGAQCGQ